jgi:hypothetical protein
MKTLISALVISAASVLPVSASLHDFNPTNAAPTIRNKAEVGQGQCLNTRDNSRVCYVKTSASNFSISIRDIDYPNAVEVAYIDCSTGRWGAYGDLPKATLDLYLDDFCTHFG